MELTVYNVDFVSECRHEFSGRCGWLEDKKCLLFDQKLNRGNYNMYDKWSEILYCKTYITFCANMP
jgi:hypothetical protein